MITATYGADPPDEVVRAGPAHETGSDVESLTTASDTSTSTIADPLSATAEAEPEPRCCRWGGLFFGDDGRSRRCYRHATDAERDLVASLDARAPGVGIKPARLYERRWGQRYGWSYGPNVHVPMRARLLDWAERLDIRLVDWPRCPHWLLTGRCAVAACLYQRRWHGWRDHPTAWTRNGRPALLLSQPYHLSDDDRAELAALAADPALTVRVGHDGWYGFGTVAVEIWRSDALAGGGRR